MIGYKTKPKGYQQIEAAALATAQTLTIPTGANIAIIMTETANVRWRDDGTAPTASVGMQLVAGDYMTYDGDLSTIQIILESGSPKLNISYYTAW